MPLRSDPRVGEAAEQMQEGVTIAWKRMNFIRMFRLKFWRQLRQLSVRQADVQVVQAMERLMQKREGEQAAGPTFRDNAAGGAVHRASG